MWVFTKHGFFSAVQHYENKELIHVRARFEGDLERLCREYEICPSVKTTLENDYPYRMDFRRQDWARIMERESVSIDYTNFKHSVADGTERDAAYMNVWRILARFGR